MTAFEAIEESLDKLALFIVEKSAYNDEIRRNAKKQPQDFQDLLEKENWTPHDCLVLATYFFCYYLASKVPPKERAST